MFANENAIRLLVSNDPTASRREKDIVISALLNLPMSNCDDGCEHRNGVVSFDHAARVLGYRNKSSVYALVKKGVLRAYYGGAGKSRATGIILSSLNKALEIS